MSISARSSSWPPLCESPRSFPVAKHPWPSSFAEPRCPIPLNVAEGSGRSPGSADRGQVSGHCTGLGDGMWGAILDVVRLFGIVPEAEWHQAKALLVRVVE